MRIKSLCANKASRPALASFNFPMRAAALFEGEDIAEHAFIFGKVFMP